MALCSGPGRHEDRTKKDIIFEQAMRVFAQKGFERATIDDIAEQAGIAKGTIYYHFKSKNELFAFLLHEGSLILIDRVQAELNSDGPVLERLERIIDVHLGFFQEYRDFCSMLLTEVLGPADRYTEHLRPLSQGYQEPLLRLIQEGQRQGVLCPVNPRTAMQSIFGMLNTVALGRIFQDKEFNADEVAGDVKRILFEGLALPNAGR